MMVGRNLMDLVSVIVPVYNTQEFLEQCVDSILIQSHSRIEIILVDDGSTDASGNLCDNYSMMDPRVKVIHQENQGVSGARNVGIEVAKGKYVTFIDADDVVTPDHVEVLYSLAIENDCDVSISGVDYVHNINLSARKIDFDPDMTDLIDGPSAAKNMLYQKGIDNGPVAKLYSRGLFRKIRFDEELAIAEDLDVNYRILMTLDRVAVVQLRTYLYRQRQGSAMRSKFNTKRADSVGLLSGMLRSAKQADGDEVNAIGNRLFIESVVVAAELWSERRTYKSQLINCVEMIKLSRAIVFKDPNSRTRFRIYAGVSLLSARAIILFFVIKKKLKDTK